MDDCFTICQYKTKEPTNIRISTPILQRFDCFGIKHAFFLVSKMAALETYNKKHGIKNFKNLFLRTCLFTSFSYLNTMVLL